jgi:hypothetical protein
LTAAFRAWIARRPALWYLPAMTMLRRTGALVSGLLLWSACSKESTPAAEQPNAPERAAIPPTEVTPAALPAGGGDEAELGAPSPLAKARFDEPNFVLEIKSMGGYKVGQAGAVEILLDAKKPFKPNDKYPYKLKLAKSDGVKFPAAVVKKDAVKLEEQRALMKVALTPESAGKKRIGGQFAFSVCTDDKCLIEKRDLAVEIQVD